MSFKAVKGMGKRDFSWLMLLVVPAHGAHGGS